MHPQVKEYDRVVNQLFIESFRLMSEVIALRSQLLLAIKYLYTN